VEPQIGLLEKLIGHCEIADPTPESLARCCEEILNDYQCECVVVAHAVDPDQPLRILAHAGSGDLMENALFRLDLEDRMALKKASTKVFSDITGKPVFSRSGNMRIQKPSSGVFCVFQAPTLDYFVLGCIHQESKTYDPTLLGNLSAVWNSWKESLWSVVRKTSQVQPKLLDARSAKNESVTLTAAPFEQGKPGVERGSSPGTRSRRSTQLVDEETSLFNKAYFDECLRVEVEKATRFSRPLSLIYLSVGKTGPAGLDLRDPRLSSRMSEILEKSVRHIDVVCRLDTNKFAVILPDTSDSACGMLARRVFYNFKKVLREEDMVFLNVAASSCPKHETYSQSLKEHVETLLEEARKTGPNKAFLFE